MKWINRERPKIDRIACPWLIKRFIDKDPEFLFAPTPRVLAVATQTGAVPYDVPDVKLTHVGSFDAFLQRYQLTDPALTQLAVIVRGADAVRPYSRMIMSCWGEEWSFMTRSTHGADPARRGPFLSRRR